MAGNALLSNIMLSGKAPAGSNRSKYLVQALKGMEGQFQGIRSPGEAIAKSLAAAISGRAALKAGEAEDAKATAQKAQVAELLKSVYGDDAAAMAAGSIDPAAAMGAFWEGRKPQTLGQGETLFAGGKAQYTAPELGVTGAGQGYSIGPQGMQDFGSLKPTQVQQWGQQNSEADRALKEAIEQGQLKVAQQNAQANMMGAGASQQNAGTNRMEYEARVKQGGFGTPGQPVAPWLMDWGVK